MQRIRKGNRFVGIKLPILGMAMFVLVPTPLSQHERRRHTEADWDCARSKDLLRDKAGKTIWLTSEELNSRVRRRSPLQSPGTLGKNTLHGTVTLQVLIDKDGRVECARAIKGHPVAISSALTSIRDWIFEPYMVNKHPHLILGEISIPYDFGAGGPDDKS